MMTKKEATDAYYAELIEQLKAQFGDQIPPVSKPPKPPKKKVPRKKGAR